MDRCAAWSPGRPATSAGAWCPDCWTRAIGCAHWPATEKWRGALAEQAEVARGDLGDVDSLIAAFDGIDVVYYLVHSMGASKDFVAEENRRRRATS